jgi:hypothetical protein
LEKGVLKEDIHTEDLGSATLTRAK